MESLRTCLKTYSEFETEVFCARTRRKKRSYAVHNEYFCNEVLEQKTKSQTSKRVFIQVLKKNTNFEARSKLLYETQINDSKTEEICKRIL